jgi:hypothetical protein
MSSMEGRDCGSVFAAEPEGEWSIESLALLLIDVRADASSSFCAGLFISASPPSMPKPQRISIFALTLNFEVALKRPDRRSQRSHRKMASRRDWNIYINMCSPSLRPSASPQTWSGPWLSPDDIVRTPPCYFLQLTREAFLSAGTPLRWGTGPLHGHPSTRPSTLAPTPLNTSTTESVKPIFSPPTPSLTEDIWRFTLYWTFVIFGGVFLAAGLWAWSVYTFKTRWAILIPVLYVMSGIFIALISGTIVGMYSLCAQY